MTADEFKTLFLPCHRRLYRMAYRLTGRQEEAEDMVQETFLRLWSRRNDLSGIENPEAFSLITLRNIWLDNIRRSRPERSDRPPEDYALADGTDIARETEDRDTSSLIMNMIRRLPDQQRLVMTMRDVSDMTFEEISDDTGLSQGNIRTLLSRARKNIREQYLRLLNHEQI